MFYLLFTEIFCTEGYRNFCGPQYRKFLWKADETNLRNRKMIGTLHWPATLIDNCSPQLWSFDHFVTPFNGYVMICFCNIAKPKITWLRYISTCFLGVLVSCTLGEIASIYIRFHFQQTLRIQIQQSQGCQKIRKIVRNFKLLIGRSTIYPS